MELDSMWCSQRYFFTFFRKCYLDFILQLFCFFPGTCFFQGSVTPWRGPRYLGLHLCNTSPGQVTHQSIFGLGYMIFGNPYFVLDILIFGNLIKIALFGMVPPSFRALYGFTCGAVSDYMINSGRISRLKMQKVFFNFLKVGHSVGGVLILVFFVCWF